MVSTTPNSGSHFQNYFLTKLMNKINVWLPNSQGNHCGHLYLVTYQLMEARRNNETGIASVKSINFDVINHIRYI